MGAAWTFVIAETLVFAACHSAISGHMSFTALARTSGRPLGAALVMAVWLWALRSAPLPVLVAVGAVTYVVTLVLVRALTRSEWRVIREVWSSFRLSRPRRAGRPA